MASSEALPAEDHLNQQQDFELEGTPRALIPLVQLLLGTELTLTEEKANDRCLLRRGLIFGGMSLGEELGRVNDNESE